MLNQTENNIRKNILPLTDILKNAKHIKKIPLPTFILGGNHENYDLLDSLKDDKKIIPNLYYLGRVSTFTVNSLLFGAISGIYNRDNYPKKERYVPPFSEKERKRARHYNEEELNLLLNYKIDILLMHEMPTPKEAKKAFDIVQSTMPRFIFSAHMHYYEHKILPNEIRTKAYILNNLSDKGRLNSNCYCVFDLQKCKIL